MNRSNTECTNLVVLRHGSTRFEHGSHCRESIAI